MAEKEYIEREAVLHELLYAMCGTGYQSRAMDAVHFVPAADVVEVVHARWIDHKNGNATCSHCRIRQTAVYDDENEQNFCGHCGAKMDGERKKQG
jgi:hypothetical protein